MNADELEPLFLGAEIRRPFQAWTTIPLPKFHPRWWFISIRGSEWFHLYLWMLKDLLWTQDVYAIGLIAGFAAAVWSMFLLGRAISHGNAIEAWHYTAQFLWLFANAWWMFAELTDWHYPHEPKIQPRHRLQAGYIMMFAWLWLLVYYGVLKRVPFFATLFACNPQAIEMYNEKHLKPHTCIESLFTSWRTYENAHIFFWLAKDCSWNRGWTISWWIFSIPTVIIALDFVWQTAHIKNGLVNHVHYIVQFLWVLANLVWAYGELFLPLSFDDPLPLLPLTSQTLQSMRWFSSWILVIAFIICAFFYIIWIAAGYFMHEEENVNNKEESW